MGVSVTFGPVRVVCRDPEIQGGVPGKGKPKIPDIKAMLIASEGDALDDFVVVARRRFHRFSVG
jgi:hypothetical protein